jgi:hypothetical protein
VRTGFCRSSGAKDNRDIALNAVRTRAVWYSAALLFSTLLISNAGGATARFFVAPSGDDTADCLSPASSCKSLTHVCDLISQSIGWRGEIILTSGSYSGGCNLTYHNVVTILGDCNAPQHVDIALGAKEYGFFIQDHAIAGINCLTIRSDGIGSIGVKSRQYAIGDYRDVQFGSMPGGVHVWALEASKINCLSATISGGAAYHLWANQQSQIMMNCQVAIPLSVAFSAFALVSERSLIEGPLASFVGNGVAGTTGLQYIVSNSTVIPPQSGFPGHGTRGTNEFSPAHAGISATRAFQQHERDPVLYGIMVWLLALTLAVAGGAAYCGFKASRRN